MNREPRIFSKRSLPADPEAPVRWHPEGDMEVFVHSQLSEPYGASDSDGLDDALSPENIEVARQCREVDESTDPDSPESIRDGLRKIGEILVGKLTIIAPGEDLDTHRLVKVRPLQERESNSLASDQSQS